MYALYQISVRQATISLSLPLAYTSRYKPWESLWSSLATTPLVDFHHRLTACPSYLETCAARRTVQKYHRSFDWWYLLLYSSELFRNTFFTLASNFIRITKINVFQRSSASWTFFIYATRFCILHQRSVNCFILLLSQFHISTSS